MRPQTSIINNLVLIALVSSFITACIRPATTSLPIPTEITFVQTPTTTQPPPLGDHKSPSPEDGKPIITVIPSATLHVPGEYKVQEIGLSGNASTAEAEISGLTWYKDYLLMLPQYPARFASEGDGAIFAIKKQDIQNSILTTTSQPIEPLEIPIFTAGLEDRIPGFEGFEAISVYENQIFLTIEARTDKMLGYLISGWIASDLSAITLDSNTLTPLEPPTDLPNSSFEALTTFGRRLLILYEANGASTNPEPSGLLTGLDLTLQDELAFPNVEYRITDATSTNASGEFWAINYFYPGDSYLETNIDPITVQYGEGKSHLNYPHVERLIAFQFTEQGIVLGNPNPIQLELAADGSPRNWEGIASLDDLGFLVVTDKHPNTILGYVAYP